MTDSNNVIENNEVNEKPKNKKKIFILVIIVILVIVGIVVGVLVLNNDTDNGNSVKEPEVETTVNDSETGNVIDDVKDGSFTQENNLYNLKILGYQPKDKVAYKLNDLYTVKLVFTDEESIAVSFDIYVNDKKVLQDKVYDLPDSDLENLPFYIVADNLVYINQGTTDITTELLYVIDKDLNMTEIYELDSVIGMIPYNYEITEDKIVVNGSRINYENTISYTQSVCPDLYVCDSTSWGKYGVTEDTIVSATYTYEVVDNKLNLAPVITEQETLKEYIDSMGTCS